MAKTVKKTTMAFYLEKAIFINRAPFEHLELDFKENGISVLTAVNGKGKTTILSYIVDAFHELAKIGFENSYKNIEDQLYRVSSSNFDMGKQTYSLVLLKFIYEDIDIDYVDIRGKMSEEQYNELPISHEKIPYKTIINNLDNQNFCRMVSQDVANKVSKAIFNNTILTYFPAYRYEKPGYLNKPYQVKLKFDINSRFSGYLKNPIEVVTSLPEIANWLLDVVLDEKMNPNNQKAGELDRNINSVVKSVMGSKLGYNINLGLGGRNSGATRLSIIGPNSTILYPSIFNVSSGEAALLCIFGELLRQSDCIGKDKKVSGIVLIDEVDKHLHITLQKEILPKLFKLFPNIQFIVSSHSPFLNMGLADEAIERAQIIDLDNNGIICEPTNNDLYKEVYEMMISDNQRFYYNFKNLQEELTELNKPIVITEGKTDIVHIIKAKEKLGIKSEFKTIQADNQPEGDSNLQKMLEQLCKIKHSNKIIAIFDRDIPKTVQIMDDNGIGYKSYGNNVFGFCISAPQSRIDNNQNEISIEYLYSDDEVHATLPNGCKLFFGDEFFETSGRHKENKDLILKNQSDRGKPKIVENNGGQGVFDLNEKNILAKKSEFADAISKDQIQISQESWNNFKPIFEKIDAIINL